MARPGTRRAPECRPRCGPAAPSRCARRRWRRPGLRHSSGNGNEDGCPFGCGVGREPDVDRDTPAGAAYCSQYGGDAERSSEHGGIRRPSRSAVAVTRRQHGRRARTHRAAATTAPPPLRPGPSRGERISRPLSAGLLASAPGRMSAPQVGWAAVGGAGTSDSTAATTSSGVARRNHISGFNAMRRARLVQSASRLPGSRSCGRGAPPSPVSSATVPRAARRCADEDVRMGSGRLRHGHDVSAQASTATSSSAACMLSNSDESTTAASTCSSRQGPSGGAAPATRRRRRGSRARHASRSGPTAPRAAGTCLRARSGLDVARTWNGRGRVEVPSTLTCTCCRLRAAPPASSAVSD